MQRTSSVKKHTRSVKETVVIYLLGVSICVYLGFLCGAVWISGNDFNEFMNNFQSFVIEGHHYIVGVTSATWKFVLVYLIGWSMAFIIGFLYRLAMIPMIFTMVIAFFVIHANDVFAMKELALVYLIIFVLMYISGPGKYSVDYVIGRQLKNKRKL